MELHLPNRRLLRKDRAMSLKTLDCQAKKKNRVSLNQKFKRRAN